mgnify:FL=1|tara:strand:+ start:824 stop:2125 length:1302 start_codon:yes stop_codon:yes gene_type:complete
MLDITNKRVLTIAIPIVLSNITVPILGAVDTAVVGQLGKAAPVAAVGVGAIIITSFYWLFGFLRMGTTGLVAQAVGSKDESEVRAYLLRALILGLLAGLFIFLLRTPLMELGLWISPASSDVEELAQKYISIRVWSAPAAIGLYGIVGWLIALERTKSVLFLQFFMNGVNVLLDIWFVLVLNWGVQGVAIATVIAEVSALILGLLICYDRFKDKSWPTLRIVFSIARLKNMLSTNLDILLRSIILEVIFVSFLLYGGKFGDVKLAANQVLLQFLHIAAHGLDGFALAAETLVGQAFGKKDRSILRKSIIVSSKLAFLLSCIMAISFLLFGSSLIDLMTTAENVRLEAKSYIIFITLVPILGVSAYMLDGIFIGATKTKDMRNMMFITLIFYVIAVLLLVPYFQNTGLWSALLISFIVRGATLAFRYPSLEKSI